VEVELHAFLTSALVGGERSASTRGKRPRDPPKPLDGSQSRSRRFEETSLATPRNEPQFFGCPYRGLISIEPQLSRLPCCGKVTKNCKQKVRHRKWPWPVMRVLNSKCGNSIDTRTEYLPDETPIPNLIIEKYILLAC
jgi:hypothetical protein